MKKVFAYHVGNRLDIKKLKDQLVFEIIHSDPTELLYKTESGGLIYIFNYGSVVFLDLEQTAHITIVKQIRDILDIPTQESETEAFNIEIDKRKNYQALFNQLILQEFNIKTAQVIMLNLAQSVALDFYIRKTEDLLKETKAHATELEKTGKLTLKGKELLKYLGKALNLKSSIAENLYIFDSPKIVWNNELLNKVDSDLNRELDITIRYRSVQENLNIIKENLDLFKDVAHHNHSSLLEWIIIILILIEIINMLLEKFVLSGAT